MNRVAGGLFVFFCVISGGILGALPNSEKERNALSFLLANINPPGTADGVVVASPSRNDPDYYYHWIRDAALVMQIPIRLYAMASDTVTKKKFADMIWKYKDLSRSNQLASTKSGPGEPKFSVDGKPFDGPWGRPQNDGPALRAITLIQFANTLLLEKNRFAVASLYDGLIPTHSVIKADLEFVAHHWREICFDLWEEEMGNHFYTRLVQRRALVDGAKLAEELGDFGAANFYRQQAGEIALSLSRFWDPAQGIIRVTLDQNWTKKRGLDVAVVLGVLHGYAGDGFYAANGSYILSTAKALIDAFNRLYDINKRGHGATVIGRYPEDSYDGHDTKGYGNGWALATAAFAELFFNARNELKKAGYLEIDGINQGFYEWLFGQKIVVGKFDRSSSEFKKALTQFEQRGEDFIQRVLFHSHPDGALSEQIRRDTGYMYGAAHLTWSYASLITARWSK